MKEKKYKVNVHYFDFRNKVGIGWAEIKDGKVVPGTQKAIRFDIELGRKIKEVLNTMDLRELREISDEEDVKFYTPQELLELQKKVK